MKKGRHRRYEEARALKRGGDLDIESILNDLSGEPDAPAGDNGELDDFDDDSEDDDEGYESAG